MAPEFLTIRTFFVGFCLGVVCFFTLYEVKKIASNMRAYQEQQENDAFDPPKLLENYPSWFKQQGYSGRLVSNDELRYSNLKKEQSEREFLFHKIPIICVIYTSNTKNVKAIRDTWSESCNHVFYYNDSDEKGKQKMSHMKTGTASSFQILCDVLRSVPEKYPDIHWAIFVKDDMFVIPENLRYLVAPLNASEGYYLGHAVNFWGVDYNIALAGFVLSRGAMLKMAEKFPDTETCRTGGKYWKQEDLYLGKHLRGIGIEPMDTRDVGGFTRFLGYDLDKMMFPGSMHRFANYYTRALHPVKCCGPHTITFPILSWTEVYKYHYMIYTMGIFSEGFRGNRAAPTAIPDHQVWQNFLLERGLPLNSSAAAYERIWHDKFGNVTVLPGIDTSAIGHSAIGGPDKMFNPTNMPEILSGMLTNLTARRAKDRAS